MTERDSITIKICRILCIFFMTYVHVNPSPSNWIGASKFLLFTGHLEPGQLRISTGDEAPQYLFNIANVLGQILGRASVPALSIIGGYLAIAAFQRREKWTLYVKERFQTLIIPLITWNVVIIALSLLILIATGSQTDVIKKLTPYEDLSFLRVIVSLTALNGESVTNALDFLRDIFVCALLLPVLISLLKKFGLYALITIWMIGLTIGYAPIVLRPGILMFYTIGVYLALQSSQLIPTREVALKLLASLSLTLAAVYFIPALHDNYANGLVNVIVRLIIVPIFIITAIALSHTGVGKSIAKLEPLAYLMFLSHASIMLVLWGGWQIVFGKGSAYPYVIFYVSAPIVTLGIVFILHKCIGFLPTKIQPIFNGRKVFLKAGR